MVMLDALAGSMCMVKDVPCVAPAAMHDVVQMITALLADTDFSHLSRQDAERGTPTSTALNMALVHDKLSLLVYGFLGVHYPDQSDIDVAIQLCFHIKG